MYDDFSEAKNKTALAISEGVPNFRTGISNKYFFNIDSLKLAVIFVFIKPGNIKFTVIPNLATSKAKDLLNPVNADLEAA